MSAHPNDPMTVLDDNGNPSLSDEITNLLHDVNTSMETLVQTNMMAQQANADMVAKQQAAHEMLVGHLSKPKQVLRDASGKIIGVK
jgi:glycine cleavage system regulatory protein